MYYYVTYHLFSDSVVYLISGLSSFSSFNIILFPGRNGDKNLDFIYIFFFGIRFDEITLTIVPPVKPVSNVSESENT